MIVMPCKRKMFLTIEAKERPANTLHGHYFASGLILLYLSITCPLSMAAILPGGYGRSVWRTGGREGVPALLGHWVAVLRGLPPRLELNVK